VLSVALDNVNEGVLVVDGGQYVTMSNINARLLLGLTDDEILGWQIHDVLRENEHLLEAFYKTIETKETQQLFSTNLVSKIGQTEETLTVNFRCLLINTAKGNSGDILILLQPIPKL